MQTCQEGAPSSRTTAWCHVAGLLCSALFVPVAVTAEVTPEAPSAIARHSDAGEALVPEPSTASCVEAFWASLPEMLERPVSLAAPGGSNGFAMPDQDALDKKFFAGAVGSQRACALRGGRYFGVSGMLPIEVAALQQGAGQFVFFGMCAPQQCGVEDVANYLGGAALQFILGWPEQFDLAGGAVEEFGSWSEMHVDFVIAGFAKCGTTALAKYLDGHPDISIADVGADEPYYEDSFFSTADILPTRRAIAAFQSRHGRPGSPYKVGIKYPHALFRDLTLMKFHAANPAILLIVLIRDPIDWLESTYRWYVIANKTPPSFGMHAMAVDPRRSGLRVHALEVHFAFWIRRLENLTFHRNQIYVLHMQSLNRAAAKRLCAFLGANPEGLPPGDIPRFNLNHRSTFDLCDAMRSDPATLHAVFQVKKELEEDYMELPLLLSENSESVPGDLLRRWSRCERLWFAPSDHDSQ